MSDDALLALATVVCITLAVVHWKGLGQLGDWMLSWFRPRG